MAADYKGGVARFVWNFELELQLLQQQHMVDTKILWTDVCPAASHSITSGVSLRDASPSCGVCSSCAAAAAWKLHAVIYSVRSSRHPTCDTKGAQAIHICAYKQRRQIVQNKKRITLVSLKNSASKFLCSALHLQEIILQNCCLTSRIL